MRVPKQVKTMDRRALLAMGAALSLSPRFDCPPERRGIVLTQPHVDGAYPRLAEAFVAGGATGGSFRTVTRRFPPLWLTWHLPNMAAAHLASQFDCRGPVHSLNAGWTTESQTRELVETCLRSGEADAVLQVSVELNPEPDHHLAARACLVTSPTFP